MLSRKFHHLVAFLRIAGAAVLLASCAHEEVQLPEPLTSDSLCGAGCSRCDRTGRFCEECTVRLGLKEKVLFDESVDTLRVSCLGMRPRSTLQVDVTGSLVPNYGGEMVSVEMSLEVTGSACQGASSPCWLTAVGNKPPQALDLRAFAIADERGAAEAFIHTVRCEGQHRKLSGGCTATGPLTFRFKTHTIGSGRRGN